MNTYFNFWKIAVVVLVMLFSFTSCMHTMMMGGHESHGGHAAAKVMKEVTHNGMTVAITIDPMTVGKESFFEVKISSQQSPPESIGAHYMIMKNSDSVSHSAHDHGTGSASSGEFTAIHANTAIKNGTLSIPFTPTVAGEFVFSIEIDALSTEVPFSVGEKKSSGMGGGMMGISSEYWYLGAMAMAGMMIVMWSARGGIFY